MNYLPISRIGFAAMVILATAACGPAVADTNAVEQAVRTQASEIVAAYNAHDAAKTASYDAPDYVGMFHGSRNVLGPAADEAGMKVQLQDSTARWDISDAKVTVSGDGDLAVYETTYAFTFTNPETGIPAHDKGNWIAIFKRQADGSMKLWRSIGTDTPPALAG